MTPQEALSILGATASQVTSLESARHPYEDSDPRPRQALEVLRLALQDARRQALEDVCRLTCKWCAAGRPVDLTPTEYKLLHYLLSNPRRVLTRNQILEHVWDYTFEGNASVLETYISYLRQKVDHVDPPLIHTVRGVGYSLRLPRDATA